MPLLLRNFFLNFLLPSSDFTYIFSLNTKHIHTLIISASPKQALYHDIPFPSAWAAAIRPKRVKKRRKDFILHRLPCPVTWSEELMFTAGRRNESKQHSTILFVLTYYIFIWVRHNIYSLKIMFWLFFICYAFYII